MHGRAGSLAYPLALYSTFVLAGAAGLWYGHHIGHGGLIAIGWILVGGAVLGVVASAFGAVRASAQRRAARAIHPHATTFHAAVVSPNRTYFTGFGRMGIAVVDATGITVLRGNPLAADFRATWRQIEGIAAGGMSVGRQTVPVLDIALVDGSKAQLRLMGDHGVLPTRGYATRLAGELEGERARYAGTNHNPPSGGSVSSTDAGRPPNGSSVATTDP
jgi:hypothetical protein